MSNTVNEALKNLEDRMDVVEQHAKLLVGKTTEIAQILEIKTDQVVNEKIEEKTQAVTQAVEEKASAIAQQVEEKRVELAEKIAVERAKSHHEIEEVNRKSIGRSQRVYAIIIDIFFMSLMTGLMGFHFITDTVGMALLAMAFIFLVILISEL